MLNLETTTELSSDDYMFLSENLEVFSENEVSKGISYIVFNRRRNIINIVKQVLENEFDELDRSIALDFWGNEIKGSQIAKKYGLPSSRVYRALKNIRERLETYLKYVLLYDECVHTYSVSDLMRFIKEESFEN